MCLSKEEKGNQIFSYIVNGIAKVFEGYGLDFAIKNEPYVSLEHTAYVSIMVF